MEYKLALAGLLVRVTLGILFFFQGLDKLFNIKIEEVVNTFMRDAERRHIPRPFVAFISYFTSLIELLAGLALIPGLFTSYAAALLSLDLLIICAAFSLMQPMWDMKHVFPRIVLLVILLVLPPQAHVFSIDFYLNR